MAVLNGRGLTPIMARIARAIMALGTLLVSLLLSIMMFWATLLAGAWLGDAINIGETTGMVITLVVMFAGSVFGLMIMSVKSPVID